MKEIILSVIVFVTNGSAQLKVGSRGNVGIGTTNPQSKSAGYDFSGMDVDEIGIYGLRYAEFVVPSMKAVRELSAQNEHRQAQINELTVTQRGESSLWIAGSELEAGIYLYTLIADGLEVWIRNE
jgi:hypothetical protein